MTAGASNSILHKIFAILLIALIIASQSMLFQVYNKQPFSKNIENSPSSLEREYAPSLKNLILPDRAPWIPSIEPAIGPQSIIAILVEFDDGSHEKDRGYIHDLIFSKMNDYVTEVSYNKTWVVGDITEWICLPNNMSYYGADRGVSRDENLYPLFRDSVYSCKDQVNFSNYDHIFIIHAGVGQETSNSSTDIWSCYCTFYPAIKIHEKFLNRAVIVPEAEARGLEVLGVYAHEFLHSLGLPDLYDITNPKIGYVEHWGIMDRGISNGDPPGALPAHPIGWSRMMLGWMDNIEEIPKGNFMNISITPIEFSDGDFANIIKLPTSTSAYYLIEIRKKIGFDKGLPSEGVIIAYIDKMKLPSRGRVRIIDAEHSTPSLDDAAFNINRSSFDDIENHLSMRLVSQKDDTYTLMIDRRGPKAELSVNDISIAMTGDDDKEAMIAVEIENSGKRRARDFYVYLFLDGLRNYERRLSLNPNSTFSFKISKILQSGEHSILVEIDPMNVVKEYDEDNNQKIKKFMIEYLVKIQSDYEGIPILFDDSERKTDSEGFLKLFTQQGIHRISAPDLFDIGPGERLKFLEWSDMSTNNSLLLNITKDVSLKLIYVKQFYLKVDPGQGVILGEGWYEENSLVNVTAVTPCNVIDKKSRLVFVNWSGDLNNGDPEVTLLMNRSFYLDSNWKDQFYLNMNSEFDFVEGDGWHDSGIMADFYITNPIVQDENSRILFKEWRGNYSGTEINASIIMDEEKYIEVIWEKFYKVSFATDGLPENTSIALIINQTLYECIIPDAVAEWYKTGTFIEFQIMPTNMALNNMIFALDHWENSKGETIGSNAIIDKNQNFTAIFIPYKVGRNNYSPRLGIFDRYGEIEKFSLFGGLVSPLPIILVFIILLVAILFTLMITFLMKRNQSNMRFHIRIRKLE